MMALLPHQLVELSRPLLIDHAIGRRTHHVGRCSANGNHIVPPIMNDKGIGLLIGEFVAEHGSDLMTGHGSMRTKSRQDCYVGPTLAML